jgi:hypothetical protein
LPHVLIPLQIRAFLSLHAVDFGGGGRRKNSTSETRSQDEASARGNKLRSSLSASTCVRQMCVRGMTAHISCHPSHDPSPTRCNEPHHGTGLYVDRFIFNIHKLVQNALSYDMRLIFSKIMIFSMSYTLFAYFFFIWCKKWSHLSASA